MASPTDRRQDEARLAGGWNEVLERDSFLADRRAGREAEAAEEAAWGVSTDRAAYGRDFDGAPLPAPRREIPQNY